MSETQRLTAWGWFLRAFAGGFGAMFGVMSALTVACFFCYAMVAAGALALSSLSEVTINPVTSYGSPLMPYDNPVMAGGLVSTPSVTSTYQCPPPIAPAQAYADTVYEARAPQAQAYPYYSTSGQTDFLGATVAHPVADEPANESEPADQQPDIFAE